MRAVLPPTHHTIFGLPARSITRFFVTCDVVAAIVQGSGSSVAGADNWTGKTKDIGEKILIGGLSFQSLAFVAYLCVFTRFHVTARRMEVETAPAGWRRVVKAVYISSSMIMVSNELHRFLREFPRLTELDQMYLPNRRVL